MQFNPVVYGYVLVTMDAVHLFIHEGREVRAAGVALQLHPYAEFLPFLETVARDASVKLCYDENDVSFAVKQVLAPLKPAVVFEWALCAGLTRSPVAVMKSRKNPTEIASLEEAFLADSVAMCHLLAWLADSVDSHITEADAAAKSTELRRALAHSLSDSFAPSWAARATRRSCTTSRSRRRQPRWCATSASCWTRAASTTGAPPTSHARCACPATPR